MVDLSRKFYKAWWFIQGHPMNKDKNGMVHDFGVDVFVANVDPETGELDPDAKNGVIEVWLETGPMEDTPQGTMRSHDPDLDVGASTYEEAIIALADKIRRKYGNG